MIQLFRIVVRNKYDRLHRLFTSVAPGFTCLPPNETRPQTIVASISKNSENLLFISLWIRQNTLHQLWFLTRAFISGSSWSWS